ncbi:hypothetical protein TNCV_4063211 [Trichonephila clavipes]|nr:hypothetical protein TNCV_4063211 [Trichonephila clavipes]
MLWRFRVTQLKTSASFFGLNNRVSMHLCTPKYCKSLSSVIAAVTFDREKNPTPQTCRMQFKDKKGQPPDPKTLERAEKVL